MHYWVWQNVELLHFSSTEFRHPELMRRGFLIIINEWRERCGFPIPVTNDARTPEEHLDIYQADILAGKRVAPPISAHPEGLAIDTKYLASSKRVTMAREALKMNEEGLWPFLGLEIATKHIHVENFDHPLYPRPTIWAGVSK